jgi:hypothetical protein
MERERDVHRERGFDARRAAPWMEGTVAILLNISILVVAS